MAGERGERRWERGEKRGERGEERVERGKGKGARMKQGRRQGGAVYLDGTWTARELAAFHDGDDDEALGE